MNKFTFKINNKIDCVKFRYALKTLTKQKHLVQKISMSSKAICVEILRKYFYQKFLILNLKYDFLQVFNVFLYNVKFNFSFAINEKLFYTIDAVKSVHKKLVFIISGFTISVFFTISFYG